MDKINNKFKNDIIRNSDRYQKERMATYADIAEDLIATGIYEFLPYHQNKNPQGDKSLRSGDIIWDVRLLKQSLDENNNIFDDYYKYVESAYKSGDGSNVSKQRLDTVESKRNACEKIMSLRRDYGEGYQPGTAVGDLIRTYAGKKNSKKDSEVFAEKILSPMLSSAFQAIFYEEGNLGIHMPRDGTRPKRSRRLSENESIHMIKSVEDSIYRVKHNLIPNIDSQNTDGDKSEQLPSYSDIVRGGMYGDKDQLAPKEPPKKSVSFGGLPTPEKTFVSRLAHAKSQDEIQR